MKPKSNRQLYDRRRSRLAPNVSPWERVLTAGAATALLYWVARQHAEGAPSTRAASGAAGLLLFRSLSGWCPAYAAAGVDRIDSKQALRGPRGVHLKESITIHRPVAEVYRFWRDFRNLPKFMKHVDEVTFIDDKRSHWVVNHAGMTLQWDAAIVNDVENRTIGWRSLENADVVSAGSVNFRPAPGGRGTELRVHLQYSPPGGKVAATLAQWLGADPASRVREDLRRLKQWLEAGEPPTVAGQPSARGEQAATGMPDADLEAEMSASRPAARPARNLPWEG